MSVYIVLAKGEDGLTAFGPFDENEAGAMCASAIHHGATPGELMVVPLHGPKTPTTFSVVPTHV